MLAMQAWLLQQLDVTNMWHWDGLHSSKCLVAWGGMLTQLTADGTALPLAAAVEGGAAAAALGGLAGLTIEHPQQHIQQQQFSSDGSAAHVLQEHARTNGSSLSSMDDRAASSSQQPVPAAAQQQQQQQHCSSRDWVLHTGQLQHLQLRNLLVDNPIRCRVHGSSDCECEVGYVNLTAPGLGVCIFTIVRPLALLFRCKGSQAS
jgi:hypothetical protein